MSLSARFLAIDGTAKQPATEVVPQPLVTDRCRYAPDGDLAPPVTLWFIASEVPSTVKRKEVAGASASDRAQLFLAAAGAPVGNAQSTANPAGSHIGNLYPFVRQQADRSRMELSFLPPEFRNLRSWQQRARAKVFEHLFYPPAAVAPEALVISRTDGAIMWRSI